MSRLFGTFDVVSLCFSAVRIIRRRSQNKRKRALIRSDINSIRKTQRKRLQLQTHFSLKTCHAERLQNFQDITEQHNVGFYIYQALRFDVHCSSNHGCPTCLYTTCLKGDTNRST